MPKVSAKREKINVAKLGAAQSSWRLHVPQSITFKRLLDQIADRGDDWAVKQAETALIT